MGPGILLRDPRILAALPPGSQVVAATRHGSPNWSETWKLETNLNDEEKAYFLKIIDLPDHAEMALGEYESQKAMAEYIPDNVAHPLAYGTLELALEKAFFLTPFRDLKDADEIDVKTSDTGQSDNDRNPNLPSPDQLVKVLQKLHKPSTSPNGKFGFHVPTFNGVVRLQNEWCDLWEEWFAQQLRSDIEWERGRRGTDPDFDEVCEEFFRLVIPRLLRPLKIKPTLVHGDLHAGNAQIDKTTGEVILFDSCCCYGHHELDLGMMRDDNYDFNDEYKARYEEVMGPLGLGPSEPEGDFDDRNALYAMRDHIINSGLWERKAHLRQLVKTEMRRLIAKHPDGYEGFQKREEEKRRTN